MNDDRVQHALEIARAMRSVAPDKRAEAITRATGNDPSLRTQVERLLSAETHETIITDAADPIASRTNGNRSGSSSGGSRGGRERIGPYAILSVLGEGGMGTVYLAEQPSPKRRVALKVLQRSLMTPEMHRRFAFEAEMLARLQHPGIAQVYAAGEAEDDRGDVCPFFAMEYIEGKPIDEAARDADMSIRDRLQLLVHICDSVQHAHSRGIVHRDLKPANILLDAHAMPKILDFGVARLTESDIQATMRTTAGQILGTVPYMSPEQISGDGAAIDTRSDVYSLGVVIHELITGSLPHDVMGRTVVEAARIITERAPKRIELPDKRLANELSAIVAKAMAHEPDRRYQTAAELGADLARTLSGEPILARPPSVMYQLTSFARRNRAVVGLGVAAVVLLALGVVGTSAGLVVSERARTRADLEARRISAINEFLVDRLLGGAAPEVARGEELTVRQILDRASAEIDDSFADDPLVRAAVERTLGTTYLAIARFPEAERHLVSALALREANLSKSDEELVQSIVDLAFLNERRDDNAQAETLYRRALALLPGGDSADPQRLKILSSLGAVVHNQGRMDEAAALLQRVVDGLRRLRGSEHADTLTAMTNLAFTLHDLGRVGEALPVYREVYDTRTRILDPLDPALVRAEGNLATALWDLGQRDDAAELFLSNLDRSQRLFGDDHPSTLITMNNAAFVCEQTEQHERAEMLYKTSLAGWERLIGVESRNAAVAHKNLASFYGRRDRHSEAEHHFDRAVAISRSVLGEDHPETLHAHFNRAVWLLDRAMLDDSQAALRDCLTARKRILGDDHPDTLVTQLALARIHAERGDRRTALREAQHILDRATALLGESHPTTQNARTLVEQWGSDDDRAARR
ncbi:MAG: serine/threonine protein kinase [Phycisphaeraceae bacterium]|nr:MAG: serine/threonine protein kinase [Phycisphaeraceae bacterium]